MEIGLLACGGCGALVPDQLWTFHVQFHDLVKGAPPATKARSLIAHVGERSVR